MPSFDEYLISYKDRTTVLQPEHQHKGMIVGNWSKAVKKGALTIETSFFDPKICISREHLKDAADRYKAFFG